MLYTTVGMPIPYTFECCDDLTAGIVLLLVTDMGAGCMTYRGAMRYHKEFPVLIPTPAGKSDLLGSIYLHAVRHRCVREVHTAFQYLPEFAASWSTWFAGDRCDGRFNERSSASNRYSKLGVWVYKHRKRLLKAMRSFVPGVPEDREHVLSLLSVHERFKSLQESFMDAHVSNAMTEFATKVYGPRGSQNLLHDRAMWVIRRVIWNAAEIQREQKPRNVVPRWKKRRRAKRLKKRELLVG